MKINVIILLILFLPLVSAVTIDMKEEFAQDETLIAKVSGNFYKPITKEDVFFYRENVRQPMPFFVAKINNEFYIYTQLFGKTQNNYSLVIKNIESSKGGLVIKENLTKYFLISNNTADFSVEPGFVIADGDFFIEVENFRDSEISLDVVTSSIDLETAEPIKLGAGEKKIYFSIANADSAFEIIKLSTGNSQYEIPVSVIGVNKTPSTIDETICKNVGKCKSSCGKDLQDLGKLDCGFFRTSCKEKIEKQKNFNFEQSEIEITMPTNTHTIREIYLYNTGDSIIENIALTLSGEVRNYASLSPSTIEKLEPDSNVKVELEFYAFDKNVEVQGKITAKEDISTSSELVLNIISAYVPSDNYKYTPSNQFQTCAELKGKICSTDETCDTDYIYAKDAKCCLGKCGKGKSSSSGKIIGWSIVVIVVIFLIWFFMKKYRGAKKEVDLEEISKGKKK